MKSFSDRLAFVLDGRAIATWATSLGFANSVADRMRAGLPPAAESLTAVTRTENVSITWLLEGSGTPFTVSYVEFDEDGAALVGTMVRDEPRAWTVCLVTNQSRYGVVLSQPGQFQRGKEKVIEYRIIEVIFGPLGTATLDAISRAPIGAPLQWCELDTEAFADFTHGLMGTYRLFGDAKRRGLLSKAKKPDIAKLRAKLDRTPVQLTIEDRIVLSHFHAMEPGDRDRYKKIGASLAKPDESIATSVDEKYGN